jgi:hypothetical protein
MLGNHLLLPINYLDAALAANQTYRIRLPFGVTLVGVNAACADTTSFILDIGTAADPDAYLDGVTVTGAASTTTLFGLTDFVNDQYPHIPADTEWLISVDYDGGAGGDASDVSITLILLEG